MTSDSKNPMDLSISSRKRDMLSAGDKKPIKVAAYFCGTEKDGDDYNEKQRDYYSNKISEHPGWELAGIFAETNCADRPELMELLRSSEEHKFDLLICPSFERFIGDTKGCVDIIRQLQKQGVNLIFEEDRIDTRNPFSEMLLTVMNAMASMEEDAPDSD